MNERVVYKYPIDRESPDRTLLPLRAASQILMVDAEYNGQLPSIWVEHSVDDDYEIVGVDQPFTVAIHGTGHPVPDDGRIWIGSAVCGPFVWHVYGWYGDCAAPEDLYDHAPMKTAGKR